MNLDEIGPWSEIKLDILRDYLETHHCTIPEKPCKSPGMLRKDICAISESRG
jgi:hypothetical protein